jgi:predicted permease
MRSFVDDLRQAVRVLAKRPRLVAAIAVPLALGIGANTAIFGMVDGVLFRPLPVREPDRLARVYAVYPDMPDSLNGSAYPVYLEYRDGSPAFDGLAAFSDAGPVNLATGSGGAERVQCSAVTGNFFEVLGVRAAHGRTIERADDGAPGASPVVVLSDRVWRHRFGADPSVVGSSLRLNGREFTVVGVTPAGFSGLDLDAADAIPDLWAPTSMVDALFPELAVLKPLTRRGFGWLQVVGRLAPGVSATQAQAALDAFAAARDAAPHDANRNDPSPRVVPAVQASLDPSTGGRTERLAWLLFGIVACVLLIACADAAGMLVVRAEERQREVAIRQAVGASRWRVARQLLAESVIVSVLGALGGLALAIWLSDVLAALSPAGFALPPEVASPVGGARVLAFTASIAALTAILFGTVPALRGSRVELTSSLKDEARVVEVGRGRIRLRYAFVVLQVALSAVLLVGAGLLLRTLWNAYRVDPGFEPSGLLVASVDVAKQGYDEARGRAVYDRLVEEARAIPGVRSAALARSVPVQRTGMRSSVELGDVEVPEDEQADLNVVGPDFFATMKIPVLRGRAFEASDLEGSHPVMVVNKAFADRYWPGQDAVGKRIKNIGPEGGAGSEIVGVVANFKAHSVREEPAPVMFSPAAQFYLPRMSVVVRTDGDPSALAGPLRAAAARIDPEMPVFNVRTGDEQLGLVLAQERVVAGLLVTFAAIAILLAATGFYALFAYLTRLRTREFAIRVALGAGRRDLVGSVVARGAACAALGAAIGLVAAGALSGVLSDLLFGVAPLDPASFAAAGLLIVAVAALACYLPARRAARVDPATALRHE